MSNRRQKLRHQIDLYWTATDGVCEYKVFANAKWMTSGGVPVKHIMELIGVWRDIGAHKAMLITNKGFDIGVRKQAQEKGIALLIVRPTVDLSELGTTNLPAVVEQVERLAAERAEPVFGFEVVHKTFGGMENGKLKMENEGEGARGRPGDKETGRQGEGVSLGGGEGETVDGGMWLVGGVDGAGGVEDKAMGSGDVDNKMMGGVWRK
jgi:hypothetical protein